MCDTIWLSRKYALVSMITKLTSYFTFITNSACLLAQSSSDSEASTGLDLTCSLVHLKQNTTMHVDCKAN